MLVLLESPATPTVIRAYQSRSPATTGPVQLALAERAPKVEKPSVYPVRPDRSFHGGRQCVPYTDLELGRPAALPEARWIKLLQNP
jgi:hypothetical protein